MSSSGACSASATSRPTVLFPTPGRPTSRMWRCISALDRVPERRPARAERRRRTRRSSAASRPSESPPNFSSIASARTSAVSASAMTPIAGTAVTSDRSLCALAGWPVARSTVGSGDIRVEIGFIATRMTSGSPVVMPPSRPPALLVRRRKPARGSPPAGRATARRRRRVDRIVHRGARPARRLEAEPDLDRLHRGNRHQHAGQPAVELPVPAHVAAEPDDDARARRPRPRRRGCRRPSWRRRSGG